VPVRRTAIFLRTSIYNGIQWAVFEPNDEPLWSSLRTSIGAFMETQFRRGAFAGRTSEQAYQVKVDAETTTPIDQAAGVVNILVAFAPLRPAEFVVVQLSQKTQATG
jgi:phage tail sheath protein FI